jgi:hypothetical protein
MERYFQVLERLVTACPDDIRQGVYEKFSQLINLRHRDFLKHLADQKSERKQVSVYAMHVLKACSGQLVHADLAEDLWESIQLNYLQERRRSCKYYALHMTILELASSLLTMHPSFLDSQHLTVSELFQVAQGLTKKYISRKTHNEALLLASCRFILVVLSTPGIQEAGVLDVRKGSREALKLRSAEVSSGLEYFLRYYTSDLLATKPAANKQVILMTKTLIPRFLSAYPEYKRDFLVFFHRLLINVTPKLEATQPVRDFVIDQMVSLTESFDSASRDLALSYLQQVALEDLEHSISSLLLLVSRLLKSHNSTEGAQVISQILGWLRSSAKLFQYVESLCHLAAAAQSEDQFSELLQILMETLETDSTIEIIVKRGLLALTSSRYASLLADLVLRQLNRRLLTLEKAAWLLRTVNAVQYAETQVASFELLLEVIVICCESNSRCQDYSQVRLFWGLAVHFEVLLMKGQLSDNWRNLLRRFSLYVDTLERVSIRAFAGVNLGELHSCREYVTTFTSRAQQHLSKILPKERKALKALDYEPGLFCMTVDAVEDLKLQSGHSILKSCLSYFEDDQLWQGGEAFKVVMKALLFKKVREYLQ